MGRGAVTELIQAGVHILRTKVSDETKRVLVQIGDVVTGQTYGSNAELWQHVGLASLPPEPVAGKIAAQALRIVQGTHDYIIASMDARGLDLYGNLGPGETCIYAAGKDGKSQARSLWKGDGSITHYTRAGNTPGGGGMMMQIDAKNDTIRILNSKGYGIIIDAEGVSLSAKKSGLSLLASGAAKMLATGQAQVDGSGILLGATGIPGLNSALMGLTGLVGTANPKVILGT